MSSRQRSSDERRGSLGAPGGRSHELRGHVTLDCRTEGVCSRIATRAEQETLERANP